MNRSAVALYVFVVLAVSLVAVGQASGQEDDFADEEYLEGIAAQGEPLDTPDDAIPGEGRVRVAGAFDDLLLTLADSLAGYEQTQMAGRYLRDLVNIIRAFRELLWTVQAVRAERERAAEEQFAPMTEPPPVAKSWIPYPVKTDAGQAGTSVMHVSSGGVLAGTPIVLDMNRNGRPDLADTNWRRDRDFDPRGAVLFDIDADGSRELCEWLVAEGDGLLVVDAGADGLILGQEELFGDATGHSNGYRKLEALFDENGDGTIRGRELEGLSVWLDDGDGRSSPDELHSVHELGITEIGVRHLDLVCTFTMMGEDLTSWDWVTEYLE